MTLADSDIPLFKEWILRHVTQIVESDHDILADYIIALLQHDGTIDQLRQICLKDLKDFLHAHTESFVEQLLDAYQSKSYLNPEPVASSIPFSSGAHQPNNSGFVQGQTQFENQGQNNQLPDNQSANNQFQNNQFGNQFQPNQFQNNQFPNNPSIPGFGGAPDGSIPFNGSPGFFQNNNPNVDSNDLFFNNQRPFRNNFRNRGNNNGYRQNRNQNRNFNNFQNSDSNAIDTGYDNNNYNNNNYNNKYQKSNRSQYLNSIASTQPDDEFVKRRLVIEKIPEDKFNQTDIQNYFEKFGEITDLSLDTNHHLAFIEYKSHHEALQAWKSPDPIFGNRFVKVYWRRTDTEAGNGAAGSNDSEQQDKIDVEAVKIVQAQKQREFEEKLAKKKANQEKMLEITKQKLKLLELQKEQAEKLLQIAQKTGDTTEISSKQSASDALHAQLEALKQEAVRLGISTQPMFPVVNHSRGGHSYRGGSARGGRGSYYNQSHGYYNPYARPPRATSVNTTRFNLDLRPRAVSVKPVPADKEEALRTYLVSAIDEYEDFTRVDAQTVCITFKDRRAAESFFYAPVNPDLGELEKHWKPNTVAKPVSESMDVDK